MLYAPEATEQRTAVGLQTLYLEVDLNFRQRSYWMWHL